jgi:hypothetical protein
VSSAVQLLDRLCPVNLNPILIPLLMQPACRGGIATLASTTCMSLQHRRPGWHYRSDCLRAVATFAATYSANAYQLLCLTCIVTLHITMLLCMAMLDHLSGEECTERQLQEMHMSKRSISTTYSERGVHS